MNPKRPKSPRLKLEVTRSLIECAIPKDSHHCMIAEAVKVAFPGARNVAVDLATIRFTDPGKRLRYTYLTPRIAQKALVNFDQRRAPEPFVFVLRNAQVTGIRQTKAAKAITKLQREALAKATLVRRNSLPAGNIPDRVGGKTPPLQKLQDNLPFARRRAFGLRGLEL